MRISDWSSDVCASDLFGRLGKQCRRVGHVHRRIGIIAAARALERVAAGLRLAAEIAGLAADAAEIFETVVIGFELVVAHPPVLHRHVGRQDAVALLVVAAGHEIAGQERSEEHTSELQSLMRISYAVFCLKKKKEKQQ